MHVELEIYEININLEFHFHHIVTKFIKLESLRRLVRVS